MQVDNDHESIKGWTQAEKFHLLTALKSAGEIDVRRVHERVPSRSREEIKAAIDYFKSIALQHPVFAKKEEKKSKVKSYKKKINGPLLKWQQEITKSLEPNQCVTETATAVRALADLEDIPPPSATFNIDIRQVYHQIANAMEGKPIVADPGVTAILNNCLVNTAERSNAMYDARMKEFLKNVHLPNKDGPTPAMASAPVEDQELGLVRHFATQQNYNPLNIPENLLKMPKGPEASKST